MAWSWQRKVVLLRLVLHQELSKPQLIPSRLAWIKGLDVGSVIQRGRAQTCCGARCCKEERDSGVLGQGGAGPLGLHRSWTEGAEGRAWGELLERLPSLSLGRGTGPRISAQELVFERSLVRHS